MDDIIYIHILIVLYTDIDGGQAGTLKNTKVTGKRGEAGIETAGAGGRETRDGGVKAS